MRFANPRYEQEELTYQEVFLYQWYFAWRSRLSDVDIAPQSPLSTTLPIVIANMNAVAGKRMAETIARYGWLAILPQDMSIATVSRIVDSIRKAHTHYETPIVVKAHHTVRDAMGLIYKRAHKCVILTDQDEKVLSLFTVSDFDDLDQYTLLWDIRKKPCVTALDGIGDAEAFDLMESERISSLPIVDNNGILIGITTKKLCIRHSLYRPTLSSSGRLDVGVAIGLNGFEEKATKFYNMGLRLFVMDTAHGYQQLMLEAVKKCRSLFGSDITIVAGNVVTKEATKALIDAGANGVKVGIGPGAMCSTRIKTGVGRPQFTAVWECAREARQHGAFVWADGWIKEPRDLCLALAAGATHGMWASIFAGTYESVGDVKIDNDGNLYKENYGMASRKAVLYRNQAMNNFELAKKQLFREWISQSTVYINPEKPSVGDIVDDFVTWLRSSMTYVWARTLEEYYEKAVIGVQSSAGYHEGTPNGKVLKMS